MKTRSITAALGASALLLGLAACGTTDPDEGTSAPAVSTAGDCAEDEADCTRVAIVPERLAAIRRGYLAAVSDWLTPAEIRSLDLGARTLLFEQACRRREVDAGEAGKGILGVDQPDAVPAGKLAIITALVLQVEQQHEEHRESQREPADVEDRVEPVAGQRAVQREERRAGHHARSCSRGRSAARWRQSSTAIITSTIVIRASRSFMPRGGRK